MLKFDHATNQFSMITSIEVGNIMMNIKIGSLPEVSFRWYDGMINFLKKGNCPVAISNMLDFKGPAGWRVTRTVEGVSEGIGAFFCHEGYPDLASFYDENRDKSVSDIDTLKLEWSTHLADSLYDFAIEAGHTSTIDNMRIIKSLIKAANPAHHLTHLNPLAHNFIANDWPVVFKKIQEGLNA